ncbi:MAG: hypothetical protein ACOCRO_04065 [Halanaerobiales bacterium]
MNAEKIYLTEDLYYYLSQPKKNILDNYRDIAINFAKNVYPNKNIKIADFVIKDDSHNYVVYNMFFDGIDDGNVLVYMGVEEYKFIFHELLEFYTNKNICVMDSNSERIFVRYYKPSTRYLEYVGYTEKIVEKQIDLNILISETFKE